MDLLSKGTQVLRESVERGVEAVRASPLLATTYDIGERKYTLRKQVAQGGFATVFLARDDRGAEWALKRMLLHRAEVRKARTEVALLKPLAHPNLVQLEAAAMWTRPTGEVEVALILEWCVGGSLSEHLWNRRNAPLSWDEVVLIISQLADAVAYLHALKPAIIHRDIKAENLLLHASGVWKLCDFGSATSAVLGPAKTEAERAALELDVSQSTTEMLRAPEQVDLYRGHPISCAVDLWAVGCVLFQLAVGRLPFDQRLGILNGAFKVPPEVRHPPALHALLRDLFQQDPAERLPAAALVRHLAAIKAGSTAAWQHVSPAHAPAATAAALQEEAAPAPAPVPSTSSAPRSASPQPPRAPSPLPNKPASKAELFAALDWLPSSSSPSAAAAPPPSGSAAPPAPVPVESSAPSNSSDPFASLDWMAAPATSSPVSSAPPTASVSPVPAPVPAPSLPIAKSSPALFDFFDAPPTSASPKPPATTTTAAAAAPLFDLNFAAPGAGRASAGKSDSTADLYAALAAPPSASAELFASAMLPPPSAPFALHPTPKAPPTQPPAAPVDLFAFDAPLSRAPGTSSPSPAPVLSPTPVVAAAAPAILTASSSVSASSPSPFAPTSPSSSSSSFFPPSSSPSFPLLDNTPTSLPPEQIRLLLSEVAYLREKIRRLEATTASKTT